tara:strand:+ start:458 stop:1078 length:621 start_codon:yes stop_codon:yes gene_type:complete
MVTEVIIFPFNKKIDLRSYLIESIKKVQGSDIEIDCLDWHIRCKEIIEIKDLLKKYGLNVISIKSSSEETIISAKSLGLNSYLYSDDMPHRIFKSQDKVYFYQGTIRSGEHIESETDIIVLGDVNPGGMVSAVGNVMIWGKLLGIAHAGKSGNAKSKISALHLRPLQLRIADKVAKGPQEIPDIGLAEQAELLSGSIVINPLTIKK